MLLLFMLLDIQKSAICHIYDGIRRRKGRLAHDCSFLVDSNRLELDSKYPGLEWKRTDKILRSRTEKGVYILATATCLDGTSQELGGSFPTLSNILSPKYPS